MATTAEPAVPRTPRRLGGVRRALAPVTEARGMARAMLWIGAGITLAFVLVALLAPVIAPYDFDTFRADGKRFPQLAAPSSDHWMGTNVQSTDVLSRLIWGTQTELKVVLAYMLRHFRFQSLDHRDNIATQMEMVFRPKVPIRVRVYERRKD